MPLVQQTYEYSVDMTYVLDNTATPIDSELIKLIVAEYEYDAKNMPMIYINLTMKKKVFDLMDDNVDKGYISLVIKKKQSNAPIPVWTTYIESQFTYFILDDNDETHHSSETAGSSQFGGDEFKLVEIALLKTKNMNDSKRVYNTILNGVSMMDIVHYGTSHMPMIIEPPNKVNFGSLLIPPLTSVSKYLKYIDDIHSIYKTSYRFFVDFNRGYLLSSSGNAVPAKGDISNSILIIEEESDSGRLKFSGQEYDTDQKAYIMRVDQNLMEENKNNFVNKSYNKIMGVSSSGAKISDNINTFEDTYGKTKTIIKRVNNENMSSIDVQKNSVENSSLYINFSKGEIDMSLITPNMSYNYRSLSNPEYTGRYLLSHKLEILKQTESGIFESDCNITLRKIMS